MPLSDFYRGTTKSFYIDVVVSGSLADISSDTLTLYIRDEDEMLLTKTADVATSGSSGRAYFEVSSSVTNALSASCYDYSIEWHRSIGTDYVVDDSSVNVKEKVSGSV